MNQYIQIEFPNISAGQSELLVAGLTSIGFEGFEEGVDSLKAYIPSHCLDEKALKGIAARHNCSFVRSVIEETNWNEVWESNFQPVIVNDFVAIRAEFHKPITGVEHEIIITPKMSFGTGHHATTFMMIQQMREIDFTGKTVFDFGTGTGILAILAEKSGADKIIAADNDDWSIANSAENLVRNKCGRVELRRVDSAAGDEQFDIILANINMNVIVDNLPSLTKQLAPSGILLLSGLLTDNENAIVEQASKFSLFCRKKTEVKPWISLRFSY